MGTEQKQGRMDFGCADLPLFSGTAIPVKGPGSSARAGGQRQSTFASCRVCLDTGKVTVKRGVVRFCSCAAGHAAQEKERGDG